MPETTETESAAQLALQTAAPVELEPHGVYAFRLADRIHVIDAEPYSDSPRRKRGTASVYDAPSFIAYHAKHKEDATELWADERARTITAVFDAHSQRNPGWADHLLQLQLRTTDAWTAWEKYNSQLLPQVRFAEHVEDRIPDFVQPSGAEMLELAQSFHAKNRVTFESSRRLNSGETQLEYREQIEASAGKKGQLPIPNTFEVALIPFEGAAPYKVVARLRYRITDGTLAIGYTLERPADVLKAAFTDVVTAIEQGTEATVLRGSPPLSRC